MIHRILMFILISSFSTFAGAAHPTDTCEEESACFYEKHGVVCPSTSPWSHDYAHIKFNMPKGFSHDDLISQVKSKLEIHPNKRIRGIFNKKSSHFEYQGLPVFAFRTGQFKTYQYPEEIIEYVVLRKSSDCLSEGQEGEYLYTRSFSDDELNQALVSILIVIAGPIVPVSHKGELWLKRIWESE